MTIIVAYDIPDNTRRTRVSKALKNFGIRIQYSVFECDLDRQKTRAMKHAVKQLLDIDQDKVHYFCICTSCYAKRSSVPANLTTAEPSAIVV